MVFWDLVDKPTLTSSTNKNKICSLLKLRKSFKLAWFQGIFLTGLISFSYISSATMCPLSWVVPCPPAQGTFFIKASLTFKRHPRHLHEDHSKTSTNCSTYWKGTPPGHCQLGSSRLSMLISSSQINSGWFSTMQSVLGNRQINSRGSLSAFNYAYLLW